MLRGQKLQAEVLHKRALDLLEKALGSRHPELIPGLSQLSALYIAQDRAEDAAELRARIEAIEAAQPKPEAEPVAEEPVAEAPAVAEVAPVVEEPVAPAEEPPAPPAPPVRLELNLGEE